MASTYSPLLRIELITTGEQAGTWGVTTNTNLGTLLEQSIAGTATVDVTASSVTLSSLNGASDQSRCAIIRAIGSPGVSRNIVAPATSKSYLVINQSNADVVIKTSVSSGVAVAAGSSVFVAYNGSDFSPVGQPYAGAIYATTGTFSGAITATTGTFSGAVSGTTGTFSGAISGTTGTFSGAVSGTTGTFSGAVTGASFSTTSDERLKTDVTTISNALDTVNALRGVSYVKGGNAEIGVIAQEVARVLPQVVSVGADGYNTVAYGNLVAVLIEAVKELSAKVKALEGA